MRWLFIRSFFLLGGNANKDAENQTQVYSDKTYLPCTFSNYTDIAGRHMGTRETAFIQ